MGCQGLFFNCLQIRVCGANLYFTSCSDLFAGVSTLSEGLSFWFLVLRTIHFFFWLPFLELQCRSCSCWLFSLPIPFPGGTLALGYHWRCCLWGFPFAILVLLQRFGKNKQNTHCFHFAHIRILLKNFNKRVPWWDLNFWEFRFDLQKNVCDTEKTGDWETR